MKKSLKRTIICFFLMLGIAGTVSAPTEAKSHVNYTKIYNHEKSIIKHNKKRIISKKRISKRQAEKDDYYAKCHPIKFKKVK